MILIIGGMGAGKREYVKALGYSDADISERADTDAPVVYGLEGIVDADVEGCMALLPLLVKKEVVCCREVGSGVIPAQRRERDSREATGRLCAALALRAERVVRIVAGIPTVIKG